MTNLPHDHSTGLGAGWLNSWLASIGVLRLLPDARLRWEGRGSPKAVFSCDEGDLANAVARALPTAADLARLAIARHREGCSEFPRSVSPEVYRERAAASRAHPGDWSLAATVTDLVPDREIVHGPFDPPMPGRKTLYDRVQACRESLPTEPTSLASRVASTLAGRGVRVQTNGLGFDVTRSSAGVDASAKVMVDPVIECLAFEGLQLFPMRGDGQRVGGLQRGFTSRASRRSAFRWPAWRQLLDIWGVDSLLDQVAARLPREGIMKPGVRAHVQRLGVTALYGSVYQRPQGADRYRAYGAERLW